MQVTASMVNLDGFISQSLSDPIKKFCLGINHHFTTELNFILILFKISICKDILRYLMNGEYFAKHHVAITRIFTGIDVTCSNEITFKMHISDLLRSQIPSKLQLHTVLRT